MFSSFAVTVFPFEGPDIVVGTFDNEREARWKMHEAIEHAGHSPYVVYEMIYPTKDGPPSLIARCEIGRLVGRIDYA